MPQIDKFDRHMRAGRRKQRVATRPRKEGSKSVGSPSISRDSVTEGTELPEITKSKSLFEKVIIFAFRPRGGDEEEPEDEVEVEEPGN